MERTVLGLLDPITDWLVRRGVHPNAITTAGFVVTCTAGLCFHLDRVPLGGFLVLLGGLFDVFDGRVARASGLASRFGSFYDSTLDRISEVIVFLGILSLYNSYRIQLGDVGMIYTVMLAMAGSLMVSYTRARAEGLGIDCKVGMMQRPERIVLIGVASLFFGTFHEGIVLKWVIIAMAITTNFTAFQRIVWVYRHTRGAPADAPAPAVGPPSDSSHSTGSVL